MNRELVLVASRTLGAILVYAACFLKEDEEGIVQNKLDAWRKSIEKQRDRSLSASVALLNAAAGRVTSLFNAIFGKQFFSVRSIAISICYSLASACIAFELTEFNSFWGWVAIFFLFFALVPSVVRNRFVRVLWLIVIVCCLPILWVVTDVLSEDAPWNAAAFSLELAFDKYAHIGEHAFGWSTTLVTLFLGTLLATITLLVLSFASDFLFLMLTRWVLRRTELLTRIHHIVGLLTLNTVAGLALSAGYLVLLSAYRFPDWVDDVWEYKLGGDTFLSDRILYKLQHTNAIFLLNLGRLNILDGVLCLAVSIVLAGVLIHRLVWPVIERPLYSLHRFGVISNKKLLWAAAVPLLLGPSRDATMLSWFSQFLAKLTG